MSQKYYNDPNFLNTIYALDLVLIQHFADMFFGGDQTRVIYSSNEYAFRKRSDENSGNLELPFLNFKLRDMDLGNASRWHPRAYSSGVFIDEIEAKVRFAPAVLNYDVSFWAHTDFDLKYAFTNVTWDANNKTILAPYVTVTNDLLSEDIAYAAHLSYTGMSYETEYNEKDWLERNKIHSASLDVEMETFNLITDVNIDIPTTLVFNFAAGYNFNTSNYDDTLEFVINHLTQEVET